MRLLTFTKKVTSQNKFPPPKKKNTIEHAKILANLIKSLGPCTPPRDTVSVSACLPENKESKLDKIPISLVSMQKVATRKRAE